MIVKFVEGSDGGAYGKWFVARLTHEELAQKSALPGFEDAPLIRNGGLRRLNDVSTLVFDMQTGQGAALLLESTDELVDRHQNLWVCPLYRSFVGWLVLNKYGRGKGDISKIPSFLNFARMTT